MIQAWRFLVHVYLFIPYWKGEGHAFRFIHHLIPWWSIGALVFALPLAVGMYMRMGPEQAYKSAMAWSRMVSYYSLWALYLFWIPLPWPRVALVIWLIALFKVYRVRNRRLAYKRSLPVPTGPSGVAKTGISSSNS